MHLTRGIAVAVWLAALLLVTRFVATPSWAAPPLTIRPLAPSMPAADGLVVCPPAFRAALEPWVEHRTAEGLTIRVVESAATAEEVSENLERSGLSRRTRFVLLVGDCRISAADRADAAVEVPTHYRLPGPTARYGTTPTLAGDAPYGDLDGDGVPEVAVGRMPVNTPDQLAGLIERIIAYEASSDFGPWRDTVQLTAGVGGFGILADAAIESATRAVLTSSLPTSIRMAITYASPSSPFNPGPGEFFPAVLRRYREGGLFWVYMGHGNVTELDRVAGPEGPRAVLAADDVELLERSADGAPIALLLACYTGAFDAGEEALAERMLLSDGGPIAVLAGSRVTMPYGNALAAQGLIQAVYHERAERLGDAWLYAQRELATDAADEEELAERRKLIDMLATALTPSPDLLPPERLEHVHLYNLLGDPALRLQHPESISLTAPRSVTSGASFEVAGVAPHAGTLTVAVCPLPGSADVDPTASRLERYEQANCVDIARVEIPDQAAGRFRVELTLPPSLRGSVRLVARMEGSDGWSTGTSRLLVRPE